MPVLITTPYRAPGGSFKDLVEGGVNSFFIPQGMEFNNDGTKMFVAGFKTQGADTGYVYEYNLASAYNVASASYSGNVLITTAENRWTSGMTIKPDGTKLYICGYNSTDGQGVYRYTLPTPWSLVGASYDSHFINLNTAFPTGMGRQFLPYDVKFRPDGTKMYVCGHGGDDVSEYALSTPWDVDITSATWNVTTTVFTATFGQISGIWFKPDGTIMFGTGYGGDFAAQIALTGAWTISPNTDPGINFSVAGQTTGPQDITLNPTGTFMYIVDGTAAKRIYQYPLGSTFDVSTATF